MIAAPPTATVKVEPAIPQVGQEATFNATATDPDGGAAPAVAWDFDGNGVFDANGPSAKHTFATGGATIVIVRLIDAANELAVLRQAVIVNRPPTVSIGHTPAAPTVGQTVTFSAEATDPDGDTLRVEWDLDGDGFDDPPRRRYAAPGDYSARVRVSDGRGGLVTSTESVTVESAPSGSRQNNPPTALISYSPSPPVAGQPVTFSADGSEDFDGDRLSYRWDLDGDGFDDGTGITATGLFNGPVRLRVTDSRGLSDEAVVVPVTLIQTPEGPRPLALLNPFPIVRIVGTPLRRGAKIKRLSVRAPTGSLVSVTCRGRDCPKRKGSSTRSKGRVIRLKRYERRLRAGTRIGIRISHSALVGKYTSFVIKRRRRPARKDMCLPPGTRKPVACLSG